MIFEICACRERERERERDPRFFFARGSRGSFALCALKWIVKQSGMVLKGCNSVCVSFIFGKGEIYFWRERVERVT